MGIAADTRKIALAPFYGQYEQSPVANLAPVCSLTNFMLQNKRSMAVVQERS